MTKDVLSRRTARKTNFVTAQGTTIHAVNVVIPSFCMTAVHPSERGRDYKNESVTRSQKKSIQLMQLESMQINYY